MDNKELDLKIYIDWNKDAHVFLRVSEHEVGDKTKGVRQSLIDLTKMLGTRLAIRIFYETVDDKKKLREFYDGIALQLNLNKEDYILENDFKIVKFWHYCNHCKYADLPEAEDPCNECLEIGVREGTEVPEKFEEAEQKQERRKK